MRLIAGMIGKNEENVAEKLLRIFPPNLDNHEVGFSFGNDIHTVYPPRSLDVSTAKGSVGIGYCSGGANGHQAISLRQGNSEGDCILLYGRTRTSSQDSISKRSFHGLIGNYILAMKNGPKLLLCKDRIGVKQVYYGEGPDLVGFSSRRDSLKQLGMGTKRLLPGDVIELTRGGPRRKESRSLDRPDTTLHKEDVAFERYTQSLVNGVKRSVEDVKSVGIVFSGGIDSSLIGKVASMLDREVMCYCAGVPSSDDVVAAVDAATSMDLPLKITELDISKLAKLLPHVIETIEDWDQLQVEAAVPVYCSMQAASEDGISVVLNGQGADELFAGYDWYSRILEREGEDTLTERMWEDLTLAYKETFERENKMAEFHDLELRVPYCDEEVIETAMSIPIKFKTKKKDEMGKYAHRMVAENLGVPVSIAWRQKDAAQHASGVHDLVKDLARACGFDRRGRYEMKTDVGRLGSVYRYGNNYRSDEERYGDDFVQSYLENMALSLGVAELSER